MYHLFALYFSLFKDYLDFTYLILKLTYAMIALIGHENLIGFPNPIHRYYNVNN